MSTEPSELDGDAIPSVKDLASSDPALRRNNLHAILTTLGDRSAAKALTPTQSLQLWRGLSVALYMHDSKNAISVQNLVATLAGTFGLFNRKDLALAESDNTNISQWTWLSTWTTAFWETISREWSGIDQWRMNKYLLLVRFCIRETFKILFSVGSSLKDTKAFESLTTSQTDILRACPLSPRERKVPDGLRLHVLDVWVDELEKARNENEMEAEKDEKLHTELEARLMEPVRDLAKESISKSVKMKAKEVVKMLDENRS